MNELIKITERNGKQAVSARELYAFLEIQTPFTMWTERMFEYGFIENVDYQSLSQKCEKPVGGRPQTDYALSVSCAKEISMLQRNDKGKQARQYFIEAENKYMELQKSGGFQVPTSFREALLLAAQQQEKIEEQQKLIETQVPKVLFASAVEGSRSSCLIGELAKIITQNGYPIGQNRLFKWMRDHGYMGKCGENYNIPYQVYVEQELFELKKGIRSGKDGVMYTTTTPKVTGKGQVYFVKKFLKQTEIA